MSSTASNYDMTKLIAGQALAALTLFLAVVAAGSTITNSLRTITPFIVIAWVYGIMMFASSYVEEEQHFWYWATTGWLLLMWIKKYVLRSLFSNSTLTFHQQSTMAKSPSACHYFYDGTHCDADSQTMEPDRPEICGRARHRTYLSLRAQGLLLEYSVHHISVESAVSCEYQLSTIPTACSWSHRHCSCNCCSHI